MRICAKPSSRPVLIQQQAGQSEVGHGHVRIDRERASKLALGARPVEVEPVEPERLFGTRFGQVRHDGQGVLDGDVGRLEYVRWHGVGAEQGAPMGFGKPDPGQGVAGVDFERLSVQRDALAQAIGAHVLGVSSRSQIELVGVGVARSAKSRTAAAAHRRGLQGSAPGPAPRAPRSCPALRRPR